MKYLFKTIFFLLLCLSLAGWSSLKDVAKDTLIDKGIISGEQAEQAEKVAKVGRAFRKGFADLTEEEEYYIGRAVAAHILSKYGLCRNDKLTNYINCVGLAVVYSSDRPEIYGGYHFAVLDTEEMVAFAAPGGFVFISRGMINSMVSEEELAGVLAHEVGHINEKHGLKAIKQSRLIEAFSLLAKEAKTEVEMDRLTQHFEGVLEDITKTLLEKGYSKKQEFEADRLGVELASKVGYKPDGLKDFLIILRGLSKERRGGLFKTHPSPEDRIAKLNTYIEKEGLSGQTSPVRTTRFRNHLKAL